jgi:hypothetical protein
MTGTSALSTPRSLSHSFSSLSRRSFIFDMSSSGPNPRGGRCVVMGGALSARRLYVSKRESNPRGGRCVDCSGNFCFMPYGCVEELTERPFIEERGSLGLLIWFAPSDTIVGGSTGFAGATSFARERVCGCETPVFAKDAGADAASCPLADPLFSCRMDIGNSRAQPIPVIDKLDTTRDMHTHTVLLRLR